jgi:Trehalose utilisation
MRIHSPAMGIALSLAMALVAAPTNAATANTPPPESTSKVKRVLLYNKIGGWRAVDGIANVNQYMASLAQAKGFVLDTLSDETSLTLEFLKQYQVIIWNNNSNGAATVPLASARQAIIDYVNQGGGWLLIGWAGMHANSWAALTEMMGASCTRFPGRGTANMQADSAAIYHPELRFVVHSVPQSISLNEFWMSIDRTVRPLPNVTVLYTTQGPRNVVLPPDDGSGDPVYVWARTIEMGKLLFCPAGWSPGQPSPLAQSDSAVAKLYWNSMRWLAGDFQNGCTDPTSPKFNPETRIDDGSCFTNKVLIEKRTGGQTDKGQIRHLLAPLIPDAEGIQNRDIRGKWIYEPQSDQPK